MALYSWHVQRGLRRAAASRDSHTQDSGPPADDGHARQPTANGEPERAAEDRSVKLVADLLAAGNTVPATLADVAFRGEAASVVVSSAEGVTTFGGADADPDRRTQRWIDDQLSWIGSEHRAVNEPLAKLRESN
jgi:hypothetical protein